MSELFSLPEQLSPRLAWMRKHKINTHYIEWSRKHWAWTGNIDPSKLLNDAPADAYFAVAGTQEEALADHAKIRGIKLWNEEGI